MTIYRPGDTGTREELAAVAAGVLAGAAVFYLARLWFRKEALPEAGAAEGGEARREAGRSPRGGGRRGPDRR